MLGSIEEDLAPPTSSSGLNKLVNTYTLTSGQSYPISQTPDLSRPLARCCACFSCEETSCHPEDWLMESGHHSRLHLHASVLSALIHVQHVSSIFAFALFTPEKHLLRVITQDFHHDINTKEPCSVSFQRCSCCKHTVSWPSLGSPPG